MGGGGGLFFPLKKVPPSPNPIPFKKSGVLQAPVGRLLFECDGVRLFFMSLAGLCRSVTGMADIFYIIGMALPECDGDGGYFLYYWQGLCWSVTGTADIFYIIGRTLLECDGNGGYFYISCPTGLLRKQILIITRF